VNIRKHVKAFFLCLLGVWGPGFEGWCDKCNGKRVGFWKTTEVVSRSGFRLSSNQPVSCSPYICETIQAHQVWTDVWNFFTHNITVIRAMQKLSRHTLRKPKGSTGFQENKNPIVPEGLLALVCMHSRGEAMPLCLCVCCVSVCQHKNIKQAG